MLLGLALGASPARADCKADGLDFFPSAGSVVPTNVIFLMEGFGTEQAYVQSLVGQQLIFKATDDIVTAKVLSGYHSEMNRVSVKIEPNHSLRPNKRYTMILEGRDSPSWESGGGPDDRAPNWLRRPAVAEGQYLYQGGKLTRFVRLEMQFEEQSPVYLVVTLERARASTAQQTYIVPVRDGKATLGHDACSGGFVLEDGKAYKATVLAYDAAGNAAPRVPAVNFQAPRASGL